MNTKLICHFLIGASGAGKSAFATQLASLENATIVSTDQIRQQLYGDENIQGLWSEVEAKVLQHIQETIAQGKSVIYDATNAKRSWRLALLQQLSQQNCHWMAWYLKTPLSICLERNQQRDRHVPEKIITEMHQSLQDFPPINAEGFAAVTVIQDAEFNTRKIQQKIASLSRSLINRNNRTQHGKIQLHFYSRLLDFERLMHLVALLIEYPGLGALQDNHPDELLKIFGEVPSFPDSLSEIVTVMGKLKGRIYADRTAIAEDLKQLTQNGLIHQNFPDPSLESQEIQFTACSESNIIAHPYSDFPPFKRLLTTIRLILNQPFLTDINKGSLKTLAETLSLQPGIEDNCYHKLRKDIEKVLKPYKILPNFSLKQGYFAGTGILSRSELKQVFGILQTHAKSIENPIALESYQLFAERMALSHFEESSLYPVRAIAHRSMINVNHLRPIRPTILLCDPRQVEDFIEQGKLVELVRLTGRGRFSGDIQNEFLAWPLQIVFHRFAWYLGFEQEGGSQAGLLRFERLDRLSLGRPIHKTRSREEQLLSLQNLQRLLEACPGIFLGGNAIEQQRFLYPKDADPLPIKIELWFDDLMFRFVSEGTQRFPLRQMKMSPPPRRILPGEKSLFKLRPTGDRQFPHRFQVIFPCWSLEDVDWLSWVFSFDNHVKVIKPQKLIDIIQQKAEGIVKVYQN